MAATIHLPNTVTDVVVKLHPVVLLSICDAFLRRDATKTRVIGTLLGSPAQEDNVVEVKNCYVVPHQDNEMVSVDIVHHKTMYELHNKVNPKEVIVGWWSTSYQQLADNLIHTFYSDEAASPTPQGAANVVYLIVDTSLDEGPVSIKAYVARSLTLGGVERAAEFLEVPCDVRMQEAERVGMHLLTSTKTDKVEDEYAALGTAFRKILTTLEAAMMYVKDVNQGKRVPDPLLGRYIQETLTMLPHVTKDEQQLSVQEQVQETLLVSFLASFAKLQVTIADKLGATSLNLM